MRIYHAIRTKINSFSTDPIYGPSKCPVYLKLPWIGQISVQFENKIKKAVNRCFQTVKPQVVYSSRKLLPVSLKDTLPITNKSSVIYLYKCSCDSMYIGRTSQRLQDRINQHVPSEIRNPSAVSKKVLPNRSTKTKVPETKRVPAIGQHLMSTLDVPQITLMNPSGY